MYSYYYRRRLGGGQEDKVGEVIVFKCGIHRGTQTPELRPSLALRGEELKLIDLYNLDLRDSHEYIKK